VEEFLAYVLLVELVSQGKVKAEGFYPQDFKLVLFNDGDDFANVTLLNRIGLNQQ
jgi:hypothetical protein